MKTIRAAPRRAARASTFYSFGLCLVKLRLDGGKTLGDTGSCTEMIEEAVADLGPQGRTRLLGATAGPGAGLFERSTEPSDIVPDFADADPFERRDRAHRQPPLGTARPDQPHRAR